MRPVALLAGLALVLAACSADPTPTPAPACPTEAPTATGAQAILEDAAFATVTVSGAVEGELTIDLRGDVAPIATASFVALARCGFFDGIWFHRVVAGFVIQAGDPGTKGRTGDFSGLGTGGPGYQFEIEAPPTDLRFDRYTVAMANDGVANGSQFFVTLADLDPQLRSVGTYTIFGEVVSGTEVIDEIAAIPVNDPRVGVPLGLATIDRVVIGAEGGPEASDGG
jgi:cyclophilin family peptidyl-prolyl cis-trans isomerase